VPNLPRRLQRAAQSEAPGRMSARSRARSIMLPGVDVLGTGQIITALTGVCGVLVGSLISWGVQSSLLGRRMAADKVLATDKFEFDKKLAEKRFSFDRELAERKFAQEREQLVFKRQFELAESLLADASFSWSHPRRAHWRFVWRRGN
jgi:hypothetical protein